ncbi:hypothetical protein N9V90_00035 [Endozoicomonas sp.]|nr:hypothetical protein [Endozoicomonas sp.]
MNYYHGIQLQKEDIILLLTNGIGKMFCAEEMRSIGFGSSSKDEAPDIDTIASRIHAASDLRGRLLKTDPEKGTHFRSKMEEKGVVDYFSKPIDSINKTLRLKQHSTHF